MASNNPLESKRFAWTSYGMVLADRINEPALGYYDVRQRVQELARRLHPYGNR